MLTGGTDGDNLLDYPAINRYEKVSFRELSSQGNHHPYCAFISVGSTLTDVVLGINMGNKEPWNSWSGFKITSLLFLICGAGIWILPLLFFCITCFIHEALFDDLYKRISLPFSNLVGMATLRREHQNLCQVVEMAVLASDLVSFLSRYYDRWI